MRVNFFANITPLEIAGLLILAAGAAVAFASEKIAGRCGKPNAAVLIKLIGLAAAIAGFFIFFL